MRRTYSVVGRGYGLVHHENMARFTDYSLDAIYINDFSHLSDSPLNQYFRPVQDLAAGSSDITFISSIPAAHFSHITSCKGRVIADKPLVNSIDELEKVSDMIAKGRLAVFFQWRSHPLLAFLKSISGNIDRIQIDFNHSFLASRETAFKWRHLSAFSAGGALGDLGVHCLAIVEEIFGSLGDTVESSLQILHSVRTYRGEDIICETDDIGEVLLDIDGRAVKITFNRCAEQDELRLRWSSGGDKNAVVLDPNTGAVLSSSLAMTQSVPRDWQRNYYRSLINDQYMADVNSEVEICKRYLEITRR
ncbi:Gfo/Idh/MocA family protein [Paludibacterium purpuratum]|uniref:Putative dehydrogenase n=1 Tax=Paludibacterium purpuratum TaxID=1144873 RepID=A0A4R7B8F9_9NEIS|nr:Gfo/Idh/MocA family oxidoreductase [Paludibacterium purpuratum]TDR80075.1 putative dehydrogenase [Paludibacterium purpuratum]